MREINAKLNQNKALNLLEFIIFKNVVLLNNIQSKSEADTIINKLNYIDIFYRRQPLAAYVFIIDDLSEIPPLVEISNIHQGKTFIRTSFYSKPYISFSMHFISDIVSLNFTLKYFFRINRCEICYPSEKLRMLFSSIQKYIRSNSL
jgi:hypothetical protein